LVHIFERLIAPDQVAKDSFFLKMQIFIKNILLIARFYLYFAFNMVSGNCLKGKNSEITWESTQNGNIFLKDCHCCTSGDEKVFFQWQIRMKKI
jgi:hypothetical protein